MGVNVHQAGEHHMVADVSDGSTIGRLARLGDAQDFAIGDKHSAGLKSQRGDDSG
jgi:hypothetical protein